MALCRLVKPCTFDPDQILERLDWPSRRQRRRSDGFLHLVLDVAPILLLAIAVAGYFFGAEAAQGEIIAVLLWIYYSAQIFFFGAEFTRQYALAAE